MWARVLAMHGAVRLVGLARVQGWIGAPEGTGGNDALRESRRIASHVHAIERRMPRLLAGNCLSRSLALSRTLVRAGIPHELVIGAAPEGEPFAAHAWVEHDGIPLNEAGDVGHRFRRMG
ncbi:hypothetical protein A6F65_01018 [Paraurantiacibacter namhicola]|uniref:Microcin J25-processing protein McjB C-terminal domain-containing protein n=2 Tax=Paraurantiacibacter namhicola TaxID=645517 RepID=A0A1C7D7A9_9SPHN|nr:hypothetical protein A6F65_01018 [Paraurantiacibacter namhicola]